MFLCVFSFFACVTSAGAFLFCSPTPRFSRLRLASKHSGHTRLVLLSNVFEHFAQMAYRSTELLTVNCPKEIFHLSPWIPFISTSYQTLPDFLSCPICAHRSAGLAVVFALGKMEALIAAFTCLLLLLLFPGTLLANNKTNTIHLSSFSFCSLSAPLHKK